MAQVIMERWQGFEWTLQGLGMLRTYITPELRMHVWDSRYMVEDVTMLHTHPWDFESLIVAGRVDQFRFLESPIALGPSWLAFVKGTIQCGAGGGECAPPANVWLEPQVMESYVEGDTYQQLANEIHESMPVDGTVTLINRTFHEDTETAHVFWPAGFQWVSAEPRPAEPVEVEDIISYSLETWFR